MVHPTADLSRGLVACNQSIVKQRALTLDNCPRLVFLINLVLVHWAF